MFGIGVLECAVTVHMVHAQTRGFVAAVHVSMMCISGATNSFVIKAGTTRHNL